MENIQNVVMLGSALQTMATAKPKPRSTENLTETALAHSFEALKLCLTHQKKGASSHNASLLTMTLQGTGSEDEDCGLTKKQIEVCFYRFISFHVQL
jgi:hypothetical protein